MAEPQDLLTQLFDAENKKAQLAQQLGLPPDASEEDIAQQRSQIEQELQMNDLKRQALTQQPVPSPSDQGDYIARILNEEASQKEASAVERESQLQDALKNYSPTMDLSGLAIGMDTVYGTNVAQALKPGANKDADLIDQLLKEKRAEPKGMTSASLLAQKGKQEDINQRQGKSQVFTAFDKVTTKFDKERKVIDDFDQQISGMENAMIDGSYERVKGQLSNFARAVNAEKGVLTDTDIGRTYIDTLDDIFNKFRSRVDKSGKMPPEELQNLASAIKDARAKFSQTSKAKLTQLQKTYSGNPEYRAALKQADSEGGGIVSGTIKRSSEIGKERFKANEARTTSGGGSGPGGAMSFEEFKASKKQ